MLIGNLVKIRAVYKSDLEVLHKTYREPEAIVYLNSRADVSLGMLEKKLETGMEAHKKGEWLVIEDMSGNVVGSISYDGGWKRDFSIEEIYVCEQYKGKGFATDAVKRLCKFLFEEKQASRISAVITEDNTPCIKVFEKSSFSHEGNRRKSFYRNGIYIDEVFMSYLANEYFR